MRTGRKLLLCSILLVRITGIFIQHKSFISCKNHKTLLTFLQTKANKKLRGRVGNSLVSFSSESLVFNERKSDYLLKKSESLPSLFCKEQFALGTKKGESSESRFARIMSESLTWLFFKERRELFTHGCSFLKSDDSKLLMVTL